MKCTDRVSASLLVAAALGVFLTIEARAQEAELPDRDRLSMLPMERLVLPIGDDGQEMEVAVYKPHTYDPERSYPLLVVLDADPLLGILKTINFLWVEEGKAAAPILVGLPFGSTPGAIWKNRSYYLLPRAVGMIDYYDTQIPLNTGGGAPELAHFLNEELMPNLLKNFSVDRRRIGLAGFSMGGLFAAWHAVTYSGTFSDYIVIAPPLAAPFIGTEFDKATQSLRDREFARPTRIYVSYAEHDLAYVRSGAPKWAKVWEALDDIDLHFRLDVIAGQRHDAGAIPALINAYEFLYGK